MARLARVVVPRIPHHVTRRGKLRLETFFSAADYRALSRCRRSIAGTRGSPSGPGA